MERIEAYVRGRQPAAQTDELTAEQKRQLAAFNARIRNGGGIFNRSSPEVQAKVMADIERQHGKAFAQRNFPKPDREAAA